MSEDLALESLGDRWEQIGKFAANTAAGAILPSNFSPDRLPTWEEVMRSTVLSAREQETKQYTTTDKIGRVCMTRYLTVSDFKKKFSNRFVSYILSDQSKDRDDGLVYETIVYIPEFDSCMPEADLKIIYKFIMDFRRAQIKKTDLDKRAKAFQFHMDRCQRYSWAYHDSSGANRPTTMIPIVGSKCEVEFIDSHMVTCGKFLKVI